MKKLLKNNLKILIMIIIALVVVTTTTIFAYSLIASDTGFTPKDTKWEVDNVKDALDDLHKQVYGKCDNVIQGIEWKYDYSGEEEIFVSPCPGIYKLETWGAQGGNSKGSYYGGYGGYSTGFIKLDTDDVLYINVGGQGKISTSNSVVAGGYNGGGAAKASTDGSAHGSGGGATHVALKSGLLSELEEYKDKILIVSGGGGGAGYYSTNGYYYLGTGGSGGGYIGGSETVSYHSNYPHQKAATGGAQEYTENGGVSRWHQSSSWTTMAHGLFGRSPETASFNFISGGGGGYYGGGSSYFGGGAGGSGYIASSKLFAYNEQEKYMTCYNCPTSTEVDTKTTSNTCHSSTIQVDCAKEGNGFVRITYLER